MIYLGLETWKGIWFTACAKTRHWENYSYTNSPNWSGYWIYVPLYSIFPGEGNGNPLQYFAWKIPWMEEPGRLQSMELQRVGHHWATSLSLSYSILFFDVSWSKVYPRHMSSFSIPQTADSIKTQALFWAPLKTQIILCHHCIQTLLLLPSSFKSKAKSLQHSMRV